MESKIYRKIGTLPLGLANFTKLQVEKEEKKA